MPIVTIETWPMDGAKKPELIRKVTDVFTGMGIPEQAVTVVIHETGQDNWGSAGEQHTLKFKNIIEDMKKQKE